MALKLVMAALMATAVSSCVAAAELKCVVTTGLLTTESHATSIAERAGNIFLYVIEPPSSLFVQPIEPASEPVELTCSSVGTILECLGGGMEVTIAMEPGKKIQAISDRQVAELHGKVRDLLTCRFLKEGETALSPD